jgi:hypothetical protein
MALTMGFALALTRKRPMAGRVTVSVPPEHEPEHAGIKEQAA